LFESTVKLTEPSTGLVVVAVLSVVVAVLVEVLGVTAAVKVTGCPYTDGLADEVRCVVVALGGVTVIAIDSPGSQAVVGSA
jgi:hypothetical protein